MYTLLLPKSGGADTMSYLRAVSWLNGNVLCVTAQLCRSALLPPLLCGRDVHEDSSDPRLDCLEYFG